MSEYTRAGHEDARRGLGFRKDYETWSTNGQWAYELGRLRCINMMAASQLKTAWWNGVWRNGVTQPREYWFAVNLAESKVGIAEPPMTLSE